MKVLHLLGACDDSGGILTVIRSLQTVLGPRGWTHTVWVNRAYRETRRPALDYCYSRHLIAESPSHLQLLWGAVRAWPELKSLLRQARFDVLHAHSRGALPLAIGVASLWRRPILFTNHSYARRVGLYRWAARRRRMYTSMLTPNMARYYGLDPSGPRLAVISSCCDDRFFSLPLPERAGVRDHSRPLKLVGIGNVVRWKNWHVVIEALGRLTAGEQAQVEFHQWGPTAEDADSRAYRAELEQRIDALGLGRRCFFHGPTLSVESALRGADWLVHPATNEPCGIVLIEALACGVPVIASAGAGPADIVIDGRTGLLFQAENLGELVRALRIALEGAARLASPLELRHSVRGRSATAVAEQFLRIYERIRWPG